jgi:repressor of nif and glnA expression
MKILSQTRRFETKTTVEDNKILYTVTTRGELLSDNRQSKAVTFDFKRLDGKKLTEKEEKIGDEIFELIIKD